VYYLIQATTHGEKVMFRGERPVLLSLARRFRECNPHVAVWVTDRPVDIFGNCLLLKARFD